MDWIVLNGCGANVLEATNPGGYLVQFIPDDDFDLAFPISPSLLKAYLLLFFCDSQYVLQYLSFVGVVEIDGRPVALGQGLSCLWCEAESGRLVILMGAVERFLEGYYVLGQQHSFPKIDGRGTASL